MNDCIQLPGPLSLDLLQLYAGCYTTETPPEHIDIERYCQVIPLYETPPSPSSSSQP